MATEDGPRQIHLEDVTPPELRCVVGACPALFRTTSGTYIGIGRRVDDSAIRLALQNRLSGEEGLFEIPQELLDNRSQVSRDGGTQ